MDESEIASTLKAISQFTMALWVLWTRAPWFSKLYVLGLISHVQVLKVGVPNVGFKPFTPQGDISGFQFSPNCGSLCWGGVHVSASSTHFDVGFFPIGLMHRSHSATF